MRPAPQAQESTSGPGESLADLTNESLVSLFRAKVKSKNGSAKIPTYNPKYDDGYICEIRQRFKLIRDFVLAVENYATALAVGGQALLRLFLKFVELESKRGANMCQSTGAGQAPKQLANREMYDAIITGMGRDPKTVPTPTGDIDYTTLKYLFTSLDAAKEAGAEFAKGHPDLMLRPSFARAYPTMPFDTGDFVNWFHKRQKALSETVAAVA
jgi:hypothetical protein